MKNTEIELTKRALAPIMRAMAVGDTENYPKSQYRSISVTASNLTIEEGKKFSKRTTGNIVEVKRIK
ncbi:hypothetical protein DWB61_03675 [Ancylomarina euxinus]|uniref:Uncharacterized protein n=1 Tax=Ancylomarina euxinus TaxID=2283627 RepID=A0A425Y785_9BACT|nr:hypothetical protein [Ancylomarina euxinus]MCZ4693901.1 hypothetical protein [Ancylomarina euxinus]MUP14679.1 hypothetical protein [Ancylomarina euxinus]RRG24225.1 hypothetical protein DWB61_03675 [Ancylomarina euxinus]